MSHDPSCTAHETSEVFWGVWEFQEFASWALGREVMYLGSRFKLFLAEFVELWSFNFRGCRAGRPVSCWDLSTGYPQVIHIREFGSLRRGPRTTAQGPRAFPHTTRALNRWFFRVNLAAWRLKTFSHTLLRGPQQG